MEVEADAVRAQVGRLINSKTFQTSEVHRRLLQYLAGKTLSGDAERLKEYTIGLEAFGKPPSYDPKLDSIVRLQAGRLRQKLMAYYQAEGPDDPVLVTLPKGAFKLSFEEKHARDGAGAEPPRQNGRAVVYLSLALVLVTAWAVTASVGLFRVRRDSAPAGRWSPELEALWAPFLGSERPLLLCLGTPMFVRFPNFGFFRDPKTNDWLEIDKSERIAAARKIMGSKDILPSYTFTGTGEASAAFLISQLLSTRRREVMLTRSSILSWQQITEDNVVFLGPPKFNPQLQAAALQRDIVIEPEGIRNLKPKQGEPVFLEDHVMAGRQSEGETHALISRTPGPAGMGEFLVIAGNASADTFGAAEWLTQPQLARLLARNLRTGSGEIPRYFQVVIKVAFKQGIPVQSSYVFHHVVDESAGGKR